MAKSEDDIPNFDNLNLPDDLNAPDGKLSLQELAAEHQGVQMATEPEPAAQPEMAPAVEVEEAQPHADEEAEPGPDNLPLYLTVAAAIGLPLIAIGLALFEILFFSTAIYIIAIGYIPLALWMGRRTNTVFVVFLACVLAAVLTACYCLWMELGRYKFDVKAQEAKQRSVMVWPGENRGGDRPNFRSTKMGLSPSEVRATLKT